LLPAPGQNGIKIAAFIAIVRNSAKQAPFEAIAMKILCFLFLVLFAGAVAVFAWQNEQDVTLSFLHWTLPTKIAAAIGVAYGLGMLSGWTVVGMLRRSANTVIQGIENRQNG
jgi:uncharacterized membrane protein YciS (DUF1049 family)